MPWQPPSPIQIFQLLPKTNCGKCGEPNCMAFAIKLVNFEASIEACKPLIEDSKMKPAYEKLKSLLAPPIREIELRGSKRVLKIGGKYVFYRHELRYMNPTAIAVDVDDSMDRDAVLKRIEAIERFEYDYVGQKLKLDAIAVRSVSGDPKQYAKLVQLVAENSGLPIVLCSSNPAVAEAGLNVLTPPHRPLLYAATKDNWREMVELAKRFEVPLVIASPGDLDLLASLSKTITETIGLQDIALDPGCFVGSGGLSYALKAYSWIRYKAVYDLWKHVGYPLVATPISVWSHLKGSITDIVWWETIMALTLMTRYADLIIMHSIDGWALLPLTMWRFQLYTDPRKPVAVPPGLREIGKPDENSPVLVTTNYALTYSIVSSDAERSKVNAWLLVVDTEGLAVDVSVAGRKFTGEKVREAIRASKLEEKLKHRVLIIPGKAARMQGDIEDATGWKVIVGPNESSEIGKFLEKVWNPENLKELTKS